jgi:hypothetical protein
VTEIQQRRAISVFQTIEIYLLRLFLDSGSLEVTQAPRDGGEHARADQ